VSRRPLSRRWKTCITLLTFAVIAYACVFVVRLAAVGVAYKAKMVCSGVFVAGRAPAAVIADLDRDDLSLLRHFSTTIDSGRRVIVSAFGAVTREAAYHADTGCALASHVAHDSAAMTPAVTQRASHQQATDGREVHQATSALTRSHGAWDQVDFVKRVLAATM
jgi:hypothetical protein